MKTIILIVVLERVCPVKGVAEGEGSKEVVFLEGATSQSTIEGGGWGVREQGQELRSDFEEVQKWEREARKEE